MTANTSTIDPNSALPSAEGDIVINNGPRTPAAPVAPTVIQPIVQTTTPVVQNVEVTQTPPAPAPPAPITVNLPEQPPAPAPIEAGPTAIAIADPSASTATNASEFTGPRYGEATLAEADTAALAVSEPPHGIRWGKVVKGALIIGAIVVAAVVIGPMIASAAESLLTAASASPTFGPILASIQSAGAWVASTASYGFNYAVGFIGEAWAHLAAATGLATLFGGAAAATTASAHAGLTAAQIDAASAATGNFVQGAAIGVGTAAIAAPALHNMTHHGATTAVLTPDSFGADTLTAALATKADLTHHAAQAEILRESSHAAHHAMEVGHNAHEQHEEHARALLDRTHHANQAWADRVGGSQAGKALQIKAPADSHLEHIAQDRANLDAALAKSGA
jgi:hypothetical protein